MVLDLTFKRSGVMILDQFAERRLIKRLQYVGEFVGVRESNGKIGTMDFT